MQSHGTQKMPEIRPVAEVDGDIEHAVEIEREGNQSALGQEVATEVDPQEQVEEEGGQEPAGEGEVVVEGPEGKVKRGESQLCYRAR